jgi:hypothetical protein
MPRTVEEALQAKAELWRRSLLDLSLRNPLLNARPRRGCIEVAAPEVTATFERILKAPGRGQLTLVGMPEPDSSRRYAAVPARPPAAPQPPLHATEVRLAITESELAKCLRGLRQRARLALSEQGVHTLFVAFGLLRWTDEDRPGKTFLAPLILQPVELRSEYATGRFHLLRTEDDPADNEVLRHQWRQVLRRNLPEWDPEGEDPTAADLTDYLQQVAAAVRDRRGWGVEHRCLIGLFSFAKLVMCEGLESQGDAIQRHRFLRALVGDAQAREDLLQGVGAAEQQASGRGRGETQGRAVPEHSVLDTDSSQEAVIAAAKRGESFVLQGPPGTGKSQTIANIIAECLGDGRRVLFVSQKRAALDVVYSRLKERGLDPFCLQLHSHLANKRDFATAVQAALEAAKRPPTSMPSDPAEQDRVLRLRDELARQLDEYVRELHLPRGAAGLTAFAVGNRLAGLLPGPDVAFPFADALQLSADTWERMEAWARGLGRLAELWDAGRLHPWYGLTVDVTGPAAESGVTSVLQAALEDARAVEEAVKACTDLLGCVPADTWERLAALQAVTREIRAHPKAPAAWIAVHPAGAEARIAALEAEFRGGQERASDLERWCTAGVRALPVEHIRAALAQIAEPRFRRLRRPEAPGTWRSTAEGLLRLSQEAVAVQEAAALLAEHLGCPPSATPEARRELLAIAEAMAADPRPLPDWLDVPRNLGLAERARARQQEALLVAHARRRLSERYDPAFFDLPVQEWLGRFKGPYSRPWRFLLAQYRADMRRVQGLARGHRPGWTEVLEDLETVHRLQAADAHLRSVLEEDARVFGPRVRGVDTDWAGVLDALDATRRVMQACGERLPARAANLLCTGGAQLRDALRHREGLASALRRLEEALARTGDAWDLAGTDLQELIALQALAHELRQAADAYDQLLHCLRPGAAADRSSCLGILDDLSATLAWEASLDEREAALRGEFGVLYAGRRTDWTAVRRAMDWADRCRAALEAYAPGASRAAAERLAEPEAVQSAVRAAQRFEDAYAFLLRRRQSVEAMFADDSPLAAGSTALPTLAAWSTALEQRMASRGLIGDWGTFQALKTEAASLGLQDFLVEARQRGLRAHQLRDALMRRLWSLWLEEAGRAAPVLARFAGTEQEGKIRRFVDLDRRTFVIRRDRLVRKLGHERARLVLERTSRDLLSAELTRLQREVTKKRLTAIRQIIKLAPQALVGLFPCVMVSPLSVAQFFAPGSVTFDTVVFDEASQIPTEDAVGAILRAQQVIVAGDKHQLPPTRFFSAGLAEDEEDETDEQPAGADPDDGEAVADDPSAPAIASGAETYASLLEECVGADIPSHGLIWHYRSRHEGLIAFSNARIYDWELLTFPCAHQEAACQAVQLRPVAGGRYGRSSDQSNPAEAQAVVAHLEELARTAPHRRVGVVAFSRAQQAAILEALEERRQAPGADALRQLTDEERPEDPFFVKNLETVQGDEREVILLSIGYGPDASGTVRLNFGPLVQRGGLRRLNVAVTRAQEQITVFTSLSQEHLARAKSEGVVGLRDYLLYAAGELALDRAAGACSFEFTDTLADLVAAELRAQGYTVQTHVGRATHRVPVAVVVPGIGRYVLGIETDGPQYHAARTTRDRERLRAAMLDRLGWRIHRTWTLAWVRDRQGELNRLLSALEQAARDQGLTLDMLRLQPQRSAPQLGRPVRRAGGGSAPLVDAEAAQVAPETAAAPRPAPQSPAEATGAGAPPTRPAEAKPRGLPAGVLEPQPYTAAVLGKRANGRPFTSEPLSTLGPAVQTVTRVEAPVSRAVVIRRILDAWQAKPLPGHRQRVEAAILWAIDRGLVRQTGTFLWPCHRDVVVRPRFPVDETMRRAPHEIAPEEAAAALLYCLARRGPMGMPSLVSEMARLFDLQAKDDDIRDWLVTAIRQLYAEGRITDPTNSGMWELGAG